MEVRPIVRHALVVIAVAPFLAALIGSAFNIWYNTTQIQPLLIEDQPRLFARSVTIFNIVVYPILVGVCVVRVWSLRTAFNSLLNGVEPDPADLARARLRSINLPWFIGGVMAFGWVLAIPAILIGLQQSSAPVNQLVLFHLPTSIVIAAILTVTNGFFVAELLVERLLFPVLFRDESPAKIPGAISLPLGRRHHCVRLPHVFVPCSV